MLHSLHLKNAFTHVDVKFDFHPGHTVITGENGKGKSLIPEMARYCLWGSQALRGIAGDYKKLYAQLIVTIRGKTYRITRSPGKAVLEEAVKVSSTDSSNPREGEVYVTIASGTRPVDAAIRNLFGYGYDVFCTANSVGQGEIAALSKMKGAERKRMVDETVGLNIIDVLEKLIADELKTANGELIGLMTGHVEPTEPTKPEEMREISAVDTELSALRKNAQVVGILQATASKTVLMPEDPKLDPIWKMLPVLEEAQERYQQDQADRKATRTQLNNVPAPVQEVHLSLIDDHYDRLVEEREYEQHVSRERQALLKAIGGTPRVSPHDPEELEREEKAYDLCVRWEKKQTLLAELQLNHCPNCNHEWHTADPRLADYEDVPVERPVYTMSKAVIRAAREGISKVNSVKGLYEDLDKLVSKYLDHTEEIAEIELKRTRRARYEAALPYETMRAELAARLAQPELEDKSKEISAARRAQAQQESYESALKQAQEKAREIEGAQEALKTFPTDLEDQIARLDGLRTALVIYNRDLSAYQVAIEKYLLQGTAIAFKEEEVDQWKSARLAMAEIRTTVKGYLLPSLNRVATSLLDQMTGGKLPFIQVDEDFEINVSGQRIETLSGAGIDVANLALRLALGTVLTNQSFSVLMLDEIDGGYDEARAEYTARCLNNLTKTFKQVIVISHKQSLISDHRIEL